MEIEDRAKEQHSVSGLSECCYLGGIFDPSGIERTKGYPGVSVFERTGVNGTLQTGTWVIRIRGYNVSTGSQTVYWATHISKINVVAHRSMTSCCRSHSDSLFWSRL
jgi:hypothetical protein